MRTQAAYFVVEFADSQTIIMGSDTRVAITIPKRVYRQAKRLAQLAHCPVEGLLTEAITLSLAPVSASGVVRRAVGQLSDQEVLALTEHTLPNTQDRRLSRLLSRQQAGKLTAREKGELISLMQVYQEALLRKAQALREAVRRGLIEPLTP